MNQTSHVNVVQVNVESFYQVRCDLIFLIESNFKYYIFSNNRFAINGNNLLFPLVIYYVFVNNFCHLFNIIFYHFILYNTNIK